MPNYTVLDTTSGKKVTFNWNGQGTPTDADMEEVFSEARKVSPKEPKPSTSLGEITVGEDFSGDMATAQTAAKIARPVLEYGGMAAGAVAGAPLGPLGSVGGAGLLYAGGKSVADALDEYVGLRESPSFGKRLAQGAKDVVTGGLMEMGGQTINVGIGAAGKYLSESNIPQRLYSSAVKMPLSQKWVKARGPEGTSNVKMAVNKGIGEKVPPSEYGLEVAKAGKADAAKVIDAEVSKMTGTFSTDEILNNGLARAIEKAQKGEAPLKDLERISKFATDLQAGRSGKLTPKELNDLKKELYELANYDKMYGKSDSLIETMRKGIAHEARLQLQAANPALKGANVNYAEWRLLEEALERSLARRSNRDIVGLGTKVLLGRETIPLAILNATIGHPQVKSKIAFIISNSGKTPPVIGRPASYLFNELSK